MGNFEDTSKGKELTEQQISQNSDVIMPVAGPVGQGTLAAVSDKNNVMVVGVDSDWVAKYPDKAEMILTSVVKQIGPAVFDTVKEAAAGNFSSTAYVGTIANGGVDIAPFYDLEDKVPAEVRANLADLKKQIGSGSLKVETKNQP